MHSRDTAAPQLHFLGLNSRLARALMKWALLGGGVASLLVSVGEAYLTYQERLENLEHHFQSIGGYTVPPLVQSLWAFDSDQVAIQLRGFVQMQDISAVVLRQKDREDIRFGAETLSQEVFERSFPLVHSENGQNHALGTLILLKDLEPDRLQTKRRLLIGVAANSAVMLLIVLITLLIYHALVRKRLIHVANELNAIQIDDLRQFDQSAATSQNAQDEIDELVQSIIKLKGTAAHALHDIDQKNLFLEKALEDLSRSQSLLKTVINASPIRVFWKDRNLTYLGCNPLFAKDAGKQSPEELIGLDDFQMGWSDQAELYRNDDRQVILSGTSKLGFEEPQTTPDGHRIWLCTSKVPLKNPQGEIDGILGIYDDITERKEAEIELANYREHLQELVTERTRELETAKAEAEAANLAKSTFLSNMSHELRTPMSAIMGMTNLALRHADDPKLIEQLRKIDQASKHLLNIINDILDISKIEADRLELEQTGFQLSQILDNLVNIISHKAQERQLQFLINLPDALAKRHLIGDPLRIGQILLNLTGNALKFTESGAITLRVAIVEERAHDLLLRWEIQDTGIGISLEDQARLFTAFEQADGSTTRKYGGTGLGLAISKRLASLMGGEIGVESAVGIGSTFWFTTRLGLGVEQAVNTLTKDSDIPSETRLQQAHAGARILLAEDEPINQEISRIMLEDADLEVTLAVDGEEAVQLARQESYDLILMDIQMPKLNGLDATRAIREHSLNAATPILAMTANAFDEDRKACLEAGMNDHIGKPIKPEQLYAVLLKWLERNQGQS